MKKRKYIPKRSKSERSKNCKYCNKVFKLRSDRLNSNFCSMNCYSKYRKEFGATCSIKRHNKQKALNAIINFKCKQCGKIDSMPKSQYKHYKNAGSFCTIHCKTKYYSSRKPLNYSDRDVFKKGKIRYGNYLINNKKIFFRSCWEANYALFLDYLKEIGVVKKWEYEPVTFPLKYKEKTLNYTPDFYTEFYDKDNTELYHEVKGYMSKQAKLKISIFKEQYPKEKLQIIGRDMFYKLFLMPELQELNFFSYVL